MERINLMTSCDENLIKQLFVQMQCLQDYLQHEVHFYLLQHGTDRMKMGDSLLERFCEALPSIHFHAVEAPNETAYQELASYGGGWSSAAYYSLNCQEYLPKEIDRCLYFDAGDTLVIGNIDPFYFMDFENNFMGIMPVSVQYYLDGANKVYMGYEENDLFEKRARSVILRGLFNAGSYMMNLSLMRQYGYTMPDILLLARKLAELEGKNSKVYWGDQGLLGALYVGHMKLFSIEDPEFMFAMPYNFCMWHYDQDNSDPAYPPSVIHYAGALKPAAVKYDRFFPLFQKENNLHEMTELKPLQRKYYQYWREEAEKAEKTIRDIGIEKELLAF